MNLEIGKISLLISFSILSCNIRTSTQSNFKSILPDTLKANTRFFVKSVISLTEGMDLKRLDKGVDSFELRIWNLGIIKPDVVLVIKCIENRWIANEIQFYGGMDRPIDSMQLKSLKFINTPEKFYDSLMQFDLLAIPDQEDIPKFNDAMRDGERFIFEISGKNYYKFFEYHCPDYYSDELNNRRISELLYFINRNLKGSDFWYCLSSRK